MAKISDVPDDILGNIMSRLPAKSFAAAASVNRLWNRVSDFILSRPLFVSGLSLTVSPELAVDDALKMALSKPIRPHFVIAFVGLPFPVDVVHNRIRSRVGRNTILITSAATGIIGTASYSNKLTELGWAYDEDEVNTGDDIVRGISLVIGYVPGLKINVLPILHTNSEPQVAMVDKFLSDVRDFTVSVSGDTNPDPVGIIVFGTRCRNIKPILAEIDTKISRDTAMVGDAYNSFVCTDPSICNLDTARYTLDAVALVFAKDIQQNEVEIKFHVGISSGIIPTGPKLEIIDVSEEYGGRHSWLLVRADDEFMPLYALNIIESLSSLIEDKLYYLYLGVRKEFLPQNGGPPITYTKFHRIVGREFHWFIVRGSDINRGDSCFLYHSDVETANDWNNNVDHRFNSLIEQPPRRAPRRLISSDQTHREKTKKKTTMQRGNSEKSKKTTDMADAVFIASMNDDLLHNILLRLPAKSFAFASCVNRSWNSVCNRILSKPKMISAFSRNPNHLRAGEEVLDKVLSEPIRPCFVIANITCGNMEETLRLIVKRVGSTVPIVVSLVAGILGKEACNDEPGEVKPHVTTHDPNFAIQLTIGYLPGMKVDVIPVIQGYEEPEANIGDKFVMDIRNYVSVVSDHAAPACLILFGEDTHATEPIIRKLDYAMPAETIIVGDQKGKFLHKRANETINIQLHEYDSRVLAGLIFARDRHRPAQAGRIHFHTAISRGMSAVDLRYKAANVIESLSRRGTFLTAKRSGEAEVLNGDQIIDDLEENLLDTQIWNSDVCIGVIKRRKYSIGLEKKPKIMASLVFHLVSGASEEYLTVNGVGLRTGDCFQLYVPDLKVAESSLEVVSSQLRNLKSKPNKTEVVGGFVFVYRGRGDSFFDRPNADCSPFLENCPELSFGGIFCGGEIGRSLSVQEEEEKKETSIRSCLHVFSSVYLIVSYTSS
ncbi:hypothetical protein AALP_AA8G467000 [Arabis alpina]|uniref:F-box domain-containing protein n=1 Tax=Arabis alpina TaxID=50452 RepID=A0A087GDW2_ARAAL|nr:hypothetical protein AALP_AA8G467000 [Arabis alpina]